MAITHLRSEKALLILCDHCFAILTKIKRMQCATCHIDLCIKCFKDGIRIRNHDYEHSYRIIDNFQFLMDENWTAVEEMLFIEALSMLGIANWDDIAEFIGTKTSEEVERFFYIRSIFENSKLNELNELQSIQSNPNVHEVVSFMPFRKDFDVEYENDYESIFKELYNDTSLLAEHKKVLQDALFNGFTNLTQIRNFKKHVILDKNLVNLKEFQAFEGTLNDFDKTILNEIKPFSKFLAKDDFNIFFSGLLIEAELKKKITEGGVKAPLNNFLDIEKKRMEFLSNLERNFCYKLRLSYKDYLKIKCKLITKYLENEHIDVEKCKAILNCRDECIYDIFNFFKQNKWI